MQSGELSLQDYFGVLRRRWPLIAGVSVLFALLGFGWSVRQPAQYSASAEVLIDFDLSAQVTDPATQSRSVADRERRLENELRFATSNEVTEAARAALGRPADASVRAGADADTLTFTATASSALGAAQEANTYTEIYVQVRAGRNAGKFTDAIDALEPVIEELRAQLAALPAGSDAAIEAERAGLQEQIQLYEARRTAYGFLADANQDNSATIIQRATAPSSPVAPQPVRSAVLALTLGLLAATGVAFLLEFLDDRIRTKDELDAVTGAAALALIPKSQDTAPVSPALLPDDTPLAEAFRSLRTSVRFAALRHPLRSLQVTSSNPNEGKTTVACHLAVAMARLGTPTVLVDGDLRNPSVHHRFNLGYNDLGLAAVLMGHVTLEQALWTIDGLPNLRVLPSGPSPANPGDFLWPAGTSGGGVAVPQVVEALVEAGYTVIVDSPPVLPVADAITLSRAVEGTIFVADANNTGARSVTRAFELLAQADARLVGTVLNRAAEAAHAYTYAYGQRLRATEPAAAATGPAVLHVRSAGGHQPGEAAGPAASPVRVNPPSARQPAPRLTTNGHADEELVGRLRNHLGLGG